MDSQQIADQIISTFESNFDNLKIRHKAHWATRMYRKTGQKRYKKYIFSGILQKKGILSQLLSEKVDDKTIALLDGNLLAHYPKKKKRFALRYVFYTSNPGIFTVMKIIQYLFFLKTFHLHEAKSFSSEFKSGMAYLSDYNLKLFLAEGLVQSYPSGSANTIYYLKYLGFSVENLEEVFKKIWLERNTSDIKNKVYGLTHIIIAASNYYQRLLESRDFEWILTYFEKNIVAIVAGTNADIVGEVGLCFKLCKKGDSIICAQCKDYVISRFDRKLKFVKSTKEGPESLSKAEHRNIIAVLLLSDWTKSYEGPDLSNFTF